MAWQASALFLLPVTVPPLACAEPPRYHAWRKARRADALAFLPCAQCAAIWPHGTTLYPANGDNARHRQQPAVPTHNNTYVARFSASTNTGRLPVTSSFSMGSSDDTRAQPYQRSNSANMTSGAMASVAQDHQAPDRALIRKAVAAGA